MSAQSKEEINLEYTETIRKKLVTSLTAGGMPKDKGEQQTLLAALDGLDKVTLTKMRISSDNANAGLVQQTAQAITDLLLRVTPSKMKSEAIHRETPILPEELTINTFVEGEEEMGTQPGSYNEFMAKFSKTE
jgi:hypothetical protein